MSLSNRPKIIEIFVNLPDKQGGRTLVVQESLLSHYEMTVLDHEGFVRKVFDEQTIHQVMEYAKLFIQLRGRIAMLYWELEDGETPVPR